MDQYTKLAHQCYSKFEFRIPHFDFEVYKMKSGADFYEFFLQPTRVGRAPLKGGVLTFGGGEVQRSVAVGVLDVGVRACI